MTIGQQVEGLVSSLRGLFEPKRTRRTGTVVRIQRDGANGTTGRPVYAVMQIGESQNEIVPIGNGMAVHTGDVWSVTGSGDPAAPDWRLDIRQQSAAPAMGADLEQDRVSLVIPTYSDPDDSLSRPIGAISEEQLNSLTGTNGAPMALVHIFPRTVVPGSYTVYGGAEFITQVSVHIRATDSDNYLPVGDYSVFPTRPLHVVLGASLAASALTVSATLPDDITINDLISNYHVYWRIKDEIAIGKLVDAGGGSYELQFTSDGRGVESTTARAHASGVKAELLCGKITAPGLEPGKSYKLYIQSVTGYGVPGEKSNEVTFTSWARTSIPAVASCTVEQREGGAWLTWTRPVSGGLPLTDVKYRIWRHTASGGTSTAGTMVADRVDALNAFIQGSNGSGNYYGIQAYDTFGNASDVTWGSDSTAPPAPSTDSWDVIPLDYSVRVGYFASSDTNLAKSDAGFKSFVLYRATDTSGTSATEVGTFITDVFDYTPPLDRAYYYQLVSRDWAGNTTSRVNDDLHWKIGLINGISDAGVVNGNLQIPGPSRTVSDTSATASSAVVSSATALFVPADIGTLVKITGAGSGGADFYGFIWEVTSATSVKVTPSPSTTVTNASMVIGGMPFGWIGHVQQWTGTTYPVSGSGSYNAPVGVKKVEYLTSGGVYGNRVLRITFAAGDYSVTPAYFRLGQYYVKPVHSGKTFINPKIWVKGSAAAAATAVVGMEAVQFSDDFGQTYLTTGVDGDTTPAWDGAWHEYSTTSGPHASARSMRLMMYVQFGGVQASDIVVDIDDVTVTFS